MKVLITGMTAQQANPASVKRGMNFTGLVVRALQERGHDVDWHNPTVNAKRADFDYYDAVVVGIAPITGLGSNRAYGALSTIQTLWESSRLSLLVDAPDPVKIVGSLNSIQKNPSNLLKEFFSYRLEYMEARHDRNAERLHEAVELLAEGRWPVTIGPRLPWQQVMQMHGLPQVGENAHLINLDRYVFDDAPECPPSGQPRHPVWAYEASDTNKRWLRTQNATWETGTLAKNVRVDTDKVALEQLRQVSGCLIAPTRTGTWWSTRYAQALSQGAPVFTEWSESQLLGPEWAQLPSLVETWSPTQRAALHAAQLASYRDAINLQDRVEDLESALTMGRA